MKKAIKYKQFDLKFILIPFIIITFVFLSIGYITIQGITNHFYNYMKENSLNYAISYSQKLAKAAKAHDILNELLEEKLLVASRSTALYDGQHSNEFLKELVKILEVDEINLYNSKGEIVYSNMDSHIGWKAFKGHPVHEFMSSGNESLVEEIRQDTESGIYFKYGYFKLSNGSFVQIGVRADKIQSFLGSFEIKQLLKEIEKAVVINHVYFIDNDLKIIQTTQNHNIDKIINNQVQKAIHENREYGLIRQSNSKKVYEIFVPVYVEGNKLGTLAIGQSLEDTDKAITEVSIIGLIALVIIYASLLLMIISTYRKNRRLVHLAYYDPLTGLPNPQYFKEFFEKEIDKNKAEDKAILLINCSDFKVINMTFGFEYGDEVLKEIGKKIQGLVDEHKILFKFLADRFVLFVKNYGEKENLVHIANMISELFNKPFKIKGAEQYIDIQMGIVVVDNKHDNVDNILKDASIAINSIKNNNSTNYAFFNDEMELKIQREDIIERELRTALLEHDTNKLYLEYQPQVDLNSNQIIGFEALARMKSDRFGFISPIEFIDIAEKKQLIVPLGTHILQLASDFINTLENHGHHDLKIAVNISGIQLLREDFIDTVLGIIQRANNKNINLELEITESVLLDNYEIINERLKTFNELQIDIALDDFGTGYSSFSRLIELNIDTLKIDKYFINRICSKECNEVIVADIISMAHKLGLNVVAEGVENEAQKRYLINHGCDIIQGYLFSRPLSKDAALQLLKSS